MNALRNLPPWHRDYVGIAFADHGRTRDGCDCWGLARLIWAERAGLTVPDYGTVYGDAHDGAGVAPAVGAGIAADWIEVAAGAERRFDAVLMRGIAADPATGALRSYDMHVGVVLAPGVLVHVERGIDAALGRYRSDRRLRRRVRGFWRHRELAV